MAGDSQLPLATGLPAQDAIYGPFNVLLQSPAVPLPLPKEWPLLQDSAAKVSLLPAPWANHQPA